MRRNLPICSWRNTQPQTLPVKNKKREKETRPKHATNTAYHTRTCQEAAIRPGSGDLPPSTRTYDQLHQPYPPSAHSSHALVCQMSCGCFWVSVQRNQQENKHSHQSITFEMCSQAHEDRTWGCPLLAALRSPREDAGCGCGSLA